MLPFAQRRGLAYAVTLFVERNRSVSSAMSAMSHAVFSIRSSDSSAMETGGFGQKSKGLRVTLAGLLRTLASPLSRRTSIKRADREASVAGYSEADLDRIHGAGLDESPLPRTPEQKDSAWKRARRIR
jgi:hypothetical protein